MTHTELFFPVYRRDQISKASSALIPERNLLIYKSNIKDKFSPWASIKFKFPDDIELHDIINNARFPIKDYLYHIFTSKREINIRVKAGKKEGRENKLNKICRRERYKKRESPREGKREREWLRTI